MRGSGDEHFSEKRMECRLGNGERIPWGIMKRWMATLLILIPVLAFAQLKVEDIVFEGNRRISDGKLKEIIKSRKGKPFNFRYLKLDQILITNYYTTRGFLDVFVEGDFDRRDSRVVIRYRITEGPQYYLKAIRFHGNTIVDSARLRKMFPLKDGEEFRPLAIEEGLNAVETYYANHGKPYVELSENRQIVNDSLIIENIGIKENETVTIVDIQYEGRKWVKEFVIRREMTIHRGEVYSRKKLDESQRNIYSTGLFKTVSFKLVPLKSREKVILKVVVVEKKPRWFAVRTGVSYEWGREFGRNTTTFDFTVQGGHRNLFGTGRSLSLKMVPSFIYYFSVGQFLNPRNEIQLTFVEPWVFYTRTPGVFSLNYSLYARPYYPASLSILNSSFQLNHRFDAFKKIISTLSYKVVRTQEDTLLQKISSGQDNILSLSAVYTIDHRDNIFNPHDGSYLDAMPLLAFSTSRATPDAAPTQNRYLRLRVQWLRFQRFPFQKNWTLASRVMLGGILEFNPRTFVPLVDRFFLGGASTVRGFREQMLGPVGRDETGELRPLGGKALFLANAEVRIPLVWLLSGVMFVDMGNVWAELSDVQWKDVRVSTGGGLAVMTPIGPIRVDVGFKLNRKPGEGAYEVHMGLGYAF